MKEILTASVIGVLLAGGPAIAHPITEAEVREAQEIWGSGIVAIGQAYLDGGDYATVAAEHVDTLYNYDEGTVLFKGDAL